MISRRKQGRRAGEGAVVADAAPDADLGPMNARCRVGQVSRAIYRCCQGLAGIALSCLAACSQAGDLGRPQRFGMAEVAIIPDAGPDYTAGLPASSFPLTDDERELRALGQNLLTPPFDPGWPHRVRGDVPLPALGYDSETYVRHLVEGPYRSAAARYARLIDDTRNDSTRVDAFFALARRVADLDHKRERSLAYVSSLTEGELTNARRRVRENMMLVAEVHRSLYGRVAMYRLALERLVIALPSPMAIEAERMRTELERRITAIQVFASARGSAASRRPAVLAVESAAAVSK